ncbi:hypothetical protein BOO71_0011788 [Deinococcus marmoris]|uniref:Uncharacterized protein n=1 Tax=Deinococcus marmoris TaxID=249408 RepID=A0A1U7NU41_9DEIO|nr:hypothetical protein BOO71_0011788 [Deinococcus marmoris]
MTERILPAWRGGGLSPGGEWALQNPDGPADSVDAITLDLP